MPHITQAMIDALPADSAGVRHLGTITVGPGVKVGDEVAVGHYSTLGAYVRLAAGVVVGERVKLGTMVWLAEHVTVEDYSTVGEYSTIGACTALGICVRLEEGNRLGKRITVGDGVVLGKGVRLEDNVVLRDNTRLGEGVALGEGVTSASLNAYFRELYARQGPTHRFSKWVTQDRMSPHFATWITQDRMAPTAYVGTPLHYAQGATLRVPDAVVSDVPYGPGLHVLSYGHRPEWYGLCPADHTLLHLTVEVQSDDILFAGLPTMDHQIRVRALTVLD